jgi:mannosidase alpha-like ER degradation enhancer 2
MKTFAPDALRTKALAVLLLLVALAGAVSSAPRIQRRERPERARVAGQVRAEFLHAWRGYERYAWGHDALRPLSKAPHDWYKESLLMTPVDALDTMIIMGLKAEAEKTRKLIVENLSFDKDVSVKNFEVTIRLLGGLLSAYQLTGDRRLLALAEDLGTRLLPVFESPTGIPYMYVNLRTGAVRQPVTNPAEAGTLLIEFGTLAKLTGKAVFYQKAKRALVEVYKRRSRIGLVGQRINVETGEWTNRNSSISAEIDSYYEYLLKCWLLFGDEDCRRMWLTHIRAINKHLADDTGAELWYGHADMDSGRRAATTYGALDAFFPAVLALSGDLRRARRLQDSSFKMWQLHGIEPEELDYKTMRITDASYALRPEIVESAYYLHHFTGDPKYLRMGETMFADFVRACKTETGYASLKSVVTKEKTDVMESFVLAETFKYFYLLHAPPRALNFSKVIFNTEAHPIRKTW